MGEVTIVIGPAGSALTRTKSVDDQAFTNRLLPALRSEWEMPGATAAQIADRLHANFVSLLQELVRRHESRQVLSGVTNIPIT